MEKEVVKKVSLQTIIELVKADYANDISLCNGCIESDLKECSQIVYVEAYLLSIVKNLISNAIKYRAPDREPEIKISSETIDQYTLLTIADNGLGINLKRHQDKLFKMFKRFHSHVTGSGIGLYIVNRLVEKQGGYIHVKSEVDKGTVFFVYFKNEEYK